MKKLLSALICLCIVGCASVESIPIKGQFVDVSNREDLIPFESYVEPDYCEVIPLGRTSTPIAQITKFKVVDNKIFIFDELTQSIFVFSDKGKPIFTLNKFGKAKNEYLEIADFCYANGLIYISDLTKRQVMMYDLKGKCVKIIDIADYWANGLFVLGKDIYMINAGSEVQGGTYHLFKIDSDGNLKENYMPFDEYKQSDCLYCTDGKSALCFQAPENVIYGITQDGCEPLFSLNFDNLNLPEEYWNLDARELMQKHIDDKYICYVENIQILGNKIIINFYDTESKSMYAVYDNNKGQVERVFRGLDINNNKYKARMLNPIIYENSLYTIYEATHFKSFYGYLDKYAREYVDKNYMVRMKKIADSIVPDSNPVIFRYKLNKTINNK